MREPVSAPRIERFMRELARASRASGRVYLTGGASSVLLGWRESTLDVDISILPVERARLRELFDAIEAELFRYPAIDAPTFRRAVELQIQ